jgi:tetratricopeptide (TPR) repeat protein
MSPLMLSSFRLPINCRDVVSIVRRSLPVLTLLLLASFSMPSLCLASKDQQLQNVVKLLELQDYQQAIESLHELEKSILNPSQLESLIAVAYMGRGYQLLASSNLSESGEAFQTGRRYNDEDIRLWQGEAMVRFRQGRYAEAVSLLDQALGIEPQNANLYLLLGQTYYADGRMEEALDALTKSSSLDGGTKVDTLLEKVRREWQVEQEMGQESRGHFQISFVDGENAAELASDVLEVLEDAYTSLGSDLAYFPDVRVPVLLYLKNDFSAVTNSPDWAGGVYDGKIRLPLGGLHNMSEQLSAVLYHEYMHVIVHFMANRHAPVWLNEGLAELSGRRLYSLPLHHLEIAVQKDQLLGWQTLAKPFSNLTHSEVLLAYEQSYSLVNFMVDRYGWHKISELLVRIGKRQAWQDAVATVYQDYGLDWPAIRSEWQLTLGR